MAIRPLEGYTVGVTAGSRASEQGELLARRGASVIAAPVLRLEPLSARTLKQRTVDLIDAPPDIVVLTTAAGIEAWLTSAAAWSLESKLLAALAGAFVVVRGAKAVEAANGRELTAWWQPRSETSGEIGAGLIARGVRGKRVAVQVDGGGSAALIADLRDNGADVVDLAPYAWKPARETEPVLSLIEAARERRVDAITFTSAPAVRQFFASAADHGLGDELRHAFRSATVCACVGATTAAAAALEGVTDVLVPPRPRLGSLVQALSKRLSARRRHLTVNGHPVVAQGAMVVVDGGRTILSPRERAVFDALARRPGAVVTRTRLAMHVWGTSEETRAVNTTVSRLRKRLGDAGPGIQTIRSRGFRLDALPNELENR